MQKKNVFTLWAILFTVPVWALDSSMLTKLLDSLKDGKSDVITGTFKATQIINTPTVEAPAKRSLQFLIMHRFGRINQGGYEFFGLDQGTIRLGIDYGITNRLSIGIGRSEWNKTFDGSFKLNLLRQITGKAPFSISLYELLTYTTLHYTDKPYMTALYRTIYTSQLLIARKINSRLSLQISPAWMHFNLVPTKQDKNDVLDITIGGRMKITKRISINTEYNYLLPNQVVSDKVRNSFSLGLDLETGGHVFQLVFSNSQGMIGPYYIAKTNGRWSNGDIYFGFNISRWFYWK